MTTTQPQTKKASLRRAITAATIGGTLEWYDVMIYSVLAGIIAKHFFPEGDDTVALIGTFGVFALGFVARPIGGILFGIWGDKIGRTRVLSIAILATSFPTAAVGLLPTYADVGMLAPILLLALRLIQGLSLGGEYAGALTFMGEFAPAKNRTKYLYWFPMACGIGELLGVAVGAGMLFILGESEVVSWGWRVAFLVGGSVGAIGIYLRRRMSETPAFSELAEAGHISRAPLRDVMQKPMKLLGAAAMIWPLNMVIYLALTYTPTHLYKKDLITFPESMLIITVYLVGRVTFIPLAARASVRFGERRVMMVTAIGFAILSMPLYLITQSGDLVWVLISSALLSMLTAPMDACAPAVLVGLFPTKVRFTSISLVLNIAGSYFGSTAPLIATLLISTTNWGPAPGIYFALSSLTGLFAIIMLNRKFNLNKCANMETATHKIPAPDQVTVG